MNSNPEILRVLALIPPAPPLPEPRGRVARVQDAQALSEAILKAGPDTTILVADGHYVLPPNTTITQHRLTLRGESGDREKVILDGGGQKVRILSLKGAHDTLIADLTFANSTWYGLFLFGDSDVQRTRVYNVKFHNIWTRGLKGTHPARPDDDGNRPPLPRDHVLRVRPSGGRVEHCLFLADTVKPYDDLFGGDYIGGMDLMMLKDWVIADNVFAGIRGRNGGGRGAIFIWIESENVLVERNVIINCDRGICFGNPSSEVVNMTSGVVRNNFIVGGANMAIEINETADTLVAHNSIFATNYEFDRTLNFARSALGGRCFNNLVHGRISLPGEVEEGHNLAGDFSGYFVDPAAGDLHLTDRAAEATGTGLALPDVLEDFDRRPRSQPPCIGAAAFQTEKGRGGRVGGNRPQTRDL